MADEQVMTIALPLPLNVTLWWTGTGARTEQQKCPECLGTRVSEVHLANGEKYSLDCACCQSGYDPPRGYLNVTVYEYTPTPFVASRVRVDGDEYWYSESPPGASSYSSVESKDLFRTREECAARCAEKTADQAKARDEGAFRHLESKRKSLAFSVHYWRGQVRKLTAELERAQARLNRCKQKEVA